MRGTDCHRSTFKVVGRVKYFKRATKNGLRKRMFVAGVKKLLGIKSPSIMAVSKHKYEYDYLKEKYSDMLKLIERGGGRRINVYSVSSKRRVLG